MPVYFPGGRALFPEWPMWHPRWALTLLSTTAVLLFLPKILSVIVLVFRKGGRRFGGLVRMGISVLVEVFFSMLFAPIRMLFHSKFVFITLLGRQVGWGAQQRAELGTGWAEAFRFHGPGMLLAALWGGALFLFNRSFFWWNTPIIIPLLLSAPLSVWSSRASAGRTLRKMGLFLIPEEVEIPVELRDLQQHQQQNGQPQDIDRLAARSGFVQAVVDPSVNALHRSMLRRNRKVCPAIARRRDMILDKALARGPEGLSKAEKREILYAPEHIEELHRRVWEISDPELAGKWGLPH